MGRTEMKAVRSMEMRGTISMSSSEAMSSSSGGVIEFRKERGSAMARKVVVVEVADKINPRVT